jgi:hypothetical protein
MYPAAIVNFGHPIDVALDIAMNYLERTGQATDQEGDCPAGSEDGERESWLGL